MLPITVSSLLSGVGQYGHKCHIFRTTDSSICNPEMLRTFVVKQTVVGEDKPPPFPQLQTRTILQEERQFRGFYFIKVDKRL